MTKKYFFYTILSLAVIACAAIGWYQNQKRETKQQMPLVATETKTNTSHKTTASTKWYIKIRYRKSHRVDDYFERIPEACVDRTRQEIETYLKSQKEEGLSSITLTSFSREKVSIEKVYDKPSGNGFMLKIKDGEVVICDKNGLHIYEKTGIYQKDLSVDDRKKYRKAYIFTRKKNYIPCLKTSPVSGKVVVLKQGGRL